MRRTLTLCTILSVAACFGCQAILPQPTARKPDWVEGAGAAEERGRFISVVGAAGPGPQEDETRRDAERATRERLATAVSDYTREMVAAFLEAQDEYPPPSSPLCQEFTAVLAAETTGGILRESIKQAVWQARDGEVHVRCRVPVAVVNAEIGRKMPYSLGHVNPFGAEAEEATARMRSFLEAQIEERLQTVAQERPAEPTAPPDDRPPAWVEVGRHEDYPADEFLSTLGLGTDLAGAERAARSELAAQVEARLSRLAERLSSTELESALAENVGWLDRRTLTFTEADLVATRVAERRHDPTTETHYVLAVLDRTTAALIYRRNIREARDRSGDLDASARNQQKAENYGASLRDYLDAVAAAREAVECQLRAMVIVRDESRAEFERLVAEPLLAQVKENLQSLLGSFRVEKAGGDGQWMPPGVPPKEPLQARVTAGDGNRPVAHVSVGLVEGIGAGEPAVRAVTDADGMAQWQLREPLLAAGRASTIVAALDLAGMVPEADLYRLIVPGTAFHYVLRSRENSHLALYLREETESGPAATRPLTTALRAALSEEGFNLLEDEEVLKHLKAEALTPEAPEADVLDAFSELHESIGPGEFLLVVVGQARAHLVEMVETDQGQLYFVHCPFKMTVLDGALPGEQKTVLTVSGTGTGAYVDNQLEATRRAQADAAAQAVSRLLSELGQKLGPPGAAP